MAESKKVCEEKKTKKNPSLEEIDNSKQFIQRCEQLYMTNDFSDIVLQVGDTQFQAHKFILTTASNVFRVMLTGRLWAEASKAEVQLQEEEECAEVFGDFLRYLYCGYISLSTDNALPMLLLADKYEIQTLRESCISYMLRHVVESPDSNRTLTWYQYAKMTGEQQLTEECRKFILSNFDIILKTADWLELTQQEMVEFLQSSDMVILSEVLLWTELQRWLLSEKNKPDLRRNLEEVVPLLRFTKISPQDLTEIEASELCQEHKDLFVDKLHQAYRHHSLAMDKPLMPGLEPYRNYTHSTYQLSALFVLENFTRVLKSESRINLQMEVPTQYYSTTHMRRPDQVVPFDVIVFPKSTLPSFRLYGSYKESTDVKVRVIRRGQHPLPMLVEVTMTLCGKKNSVKYVAFTHHAQHVFTRESSELQIEKIMEVSKLEDDNSPFLVHGGLYGRIYLRLQDVGEHLRPPEQAAS